LVLNPDCGLSSTARIAGAECAYTKLTAMCQGAELLRQMF
jgi:methionine synthase II (cobalamin-independent)